MSYLDKLVSAVSKNNSRLVIGLDPDLTKLPAFILKYKSPVTEFNRLIVECTSDITAGYKLNMAFYEYLMKQGIDAVRETLEVIPGNLITVCDAKRSDIDNTAGMYAKTYFDVYGFDAITLSPYMGQDSVMPFLGSEDKFVYLLALTSNKSSGDFQMLKTDGRFLYEAVIEKSIRWSRKNNIGYVFGANHTEEIRMFAGSYPEISLLIPGIGAQANDLNKLMNSLGSKSNFIINSSRNIIYSFEYNCNEREFVDSVRYSAQKLKEEINSLIVSERN